MCRYVEAEVGGGGGVYSHRKLSLNPSVSPLSTNEKHVFASVEPYVERKRVVCEWMPPWAEENLSFFGLLSVKDSFIGDERVRGISAGDRPPLVLGWFFFHTIDLSAAAHPAA